MLKILLLDSVMKFIPGTFSFSLTPALIKFFGIPYTEQNFYPNIPGSVLSGIVIAIHALSGSPITNLLLKSSIGGNLKR